MRKLKLLVQLSIDGYLATTDDKTDWMIWNWGPEWGWDEQLQKDFTELETSIGTILLSRKMAVEGFVAHWEAAAAREGDPQQRFAQHLTDVPKVVFSKTLTTSEWPRTTIASGDLADEVNKLKKQEGKDLIVYGGAALVSSLIKANLIDEYYLYINPAALGSGLGIFNTLDKPLDLELVKAQSYTSGMTVLQYNKKN